MKMFCRRKITILILLLCVTLILCVFYMAIGSTSPSYNVNNLSLPSKWRKQNTCFIDKDVKNNRTRASVLQWAAHFRDLIKIQQPSLYDRNYTQGCAQDTFYSNMEDNLEKALNYKVSNNAPCLQDNLYEQDIGKSQKYSNSHNIPVIVTAASSNHYLETQAFFLSIDSQMRPMYPDLRVVLYDIGLTDAQRKSMKKYCKCEVRQFEFDKFPPHVRIIQAFAWKPLMIYEVLQEFDFVMWVDVSIRFKAIKSAWDNVFNRTKQTGIQMQQNPAEWKVNKQTKQETFVFMEEPECLFGYPELEGGWILLWKSVFTMNAVMRPWVGCALTEDCMTHPFPTYLKSCSNDLWKFLLGTRCHRFDQSVINLILIRIFNKHRRLVEFDIRNLGSVQRGSTAHYFPD